MTSAPTVPEFTGTGTDWQAFFCSLLIAIHGIGEYERVPDQDSGDLGIEAFSFSGRAYQCYAVQAGASLKERYENQRDKMTEDIGKFCNRRAEFSKLLGDVRITAWNFVVPKMESKKLIQHAVAQTKRVRDAALPYASDAIRVVVITQEDLTPFILSLNRLAAQHVNLSQRNPTDSDIAALSTAQPMQIANLKAKLDRLFSGKPSQFRRRQQTSMLKTSLTGENYLEDLRDASPDTYARVRSCIQARYRRLELFGPLHAAPRDVLELELNHLVNDLSTNAPELSMDDRELVVGSAIARWLMLCPLDFS